MNSFFLKMKVSQILSKPGFYILACAIALNYLNLVGEPFLWCSILYGMTILNRRTIIKETAAETELFDAQVPQILDNIIEECFISYRLNYESANIKKKYIDSEKEKEILQIVADSVLTRMSKTMILKIRAYYNSDAVEDILIDRIHMFVIDYAIQNNAIEDDGPELDVEYEEKYKKRMVNIL